MARQWRIEFPGAIYHVLSRGNDRREIFCSDNDRQRFLELLGDMGERFEIEVHAYVLMDNHYHLLLKTRQANLSKAMQWFGTAYSRNFNLLNHCDGHLFRGRFKSIIVENDAYLFRLSCYIHRNPLRAGIVERLAEYPWSSYLHYAYSKKPPVWLTTDAIFSQLSGEDRHKAYRIKVRQYAEEQGSIWEDIKHGLIYGGRNFIEDIKARFLSDQLNAELPQQRHLLRTDDPRQLIRKAAILLDFDLESIHGRKRLRSPDQKEKRDILMYLLWKTGQFSNQTLGSMLGVSYSAVSKIVGGLKERIRSDHTLRGKFNQINSQFKV
jgi:putative transposase